MSDFLGYHLGVKRLSTASVMLVVALLFAPALMAQLHGLPPTATSLGPGGRVVSPLPPTATSIGPAGLGNHGGFGRSGPAFIGRPGLGHHHHHNGNFVGGFPLYFPWGVPVMVAPYDLNDNAYDSEEEVQYDQAPAPTVFERGFRNLPPRRYPDRADDVDDYSTPARAAEAAPAAPAPGSSTSSKPASPPPASVLIFKDGRKVQVENYAIVGETLYDFTPGHQRKVQLSQLDLKATTDANEDLGLDFQVPAKPE